MEDLKREGFKESVETFDVLLAWWFKMIYGLRKSDDTTRICIHLPVNLRPKRIFSGAAALTDPYINNASSTIPLPEIPANTFQTVSLGELAVQIRRAITAYHADSFTIEDELRWRNQGPMTVLVRGTPDGESELQTNWCDARLSELDFSGAREHGSDYKLARVLFVLANTMPENHTALQGHGAILMEDENAIWMSQAMGRRQCENLSLSGSIFDRGDI
ncbi:hypothetical protein B0H19DRAFT_1249065 [Mycena capillaripes]|nr:hypothetical protein B0H19DRAFT_1249065 [Mycena capillaripes]